VKEEIDVLIPIYNSNRDYLCASIDSIHNQTIKNNIICILNGMDSNKNELYRNLLSKLGVQIIVECPYKGVASALNYGFKFSKSQFIARQDDDDISHPERLYLQYDFMKNNNIDVLGTNIKIINKFNQIIEKRKYPVKDYECKKTLVSRTCFAHPSVMMRREFMLNNSYPLTGSEDYALWLTGYYSSNYSNLPKYLYYWRRHENQASSKVIPYLYSRKSLQIIKNEFNLFSKINLYFVLLLRILICFIKRRKIDNETIL
tara:strand:+ start:943 stop:1719 length:777 start_codon:yes stop_codon:yes gene_type:complete